SASERVAPGGRELGGFAIVERGVEVFAAVAGSFHDHHAAADGVADGGPVVGPPFDGDVAALVGASGVVESRSGAVQFDQQEVAGAECVGGRADRRSGSAAAEYRDRADA